MHVYFWPRFEFIDRVAWADRDATIAEHIEPRPFAIRRLGTLYPGMVFQKLFGERPRTLWLANPRQRLLGAKTQCRVDFAQLGHSIREYGGSLRCRLAQGWPLCQPGRIDRGTRLGHTPAHLIEGIGQYPRHTLVCADGLQQLPHR